MTQLLDLISDGNVVLMRAIEKFDFSRGQKFSTYCSWAVMKHYARSIPESNYQQRWTGAIGPEMWQQVARDVRVADYHKPQLDAVRVNLEEGLAVLPARERMVLVEHYGLNCAAGEVGRGKTLSQIGRLLGVTKERVRQIEAGALSRLRRLLGADFLEELAPA
jgi:RNA polymerase primary sigma factor